ncbi:MAG TPA: hypothetical protein VME01_09595, partial [Solirubrobacteraceae bacterium]|nr:hypothetical protein [Solirubrobacteraceae bacterium]
MGTTSPRSLLQRPTQNWLELVLFSVAGIAVALAELLLAHAAEIEAVQRTDPFTGKPVVVDVREVLPPHWFNHSLAITSAALLLVCVVLAAICSRAENRHSLTTLLRAPRVIITIGSFYGGTLVAAGIRFYLGHISVSSFATGAAPIVAGILVGVIVAG